MSGKKPKTQEIRRQARKTRPKAKIRPKRAGKANGGAGNGLPAVEAPEVDVEGAEASPAGRSKFPVFESIGQAAAILGAPQALLKAAKRQGCRAFISGSRVDAGMLIPFLFGMMTKSKDLPEGMASAADWLSMEKAKREAIKRQTDEKTTMLVSEARRQAGEACGFFFAELERAERELPPSLAGGTAVDISKQLHQFTETLRKAGKAKFEEVGK